MSYTIELDHPSDPRFLIVDALPERVTMADLGEMKYGKLLIAPPGVGEHVVYPQPEGPGSDWVHPETVSSPATGPRKPLGGYAIKTADGRVYEGQLGVEIRKTFDKRNREADYEQPQVVYECLANGVWHRVFTDELAEVNGIPV